jgi:hypothetical protein
MVIDSYSAFNTLDYKGHNQTKPNQTKPNQTKQHHQLVKCNAWDGIGATHKNQLVLIVATSDTKERIGHRSIDSNQLVEHDNLRYGVAM